MFKSVNSDRLSTTVFSSTVFWPINNSFLFYFTINLHLGFLIISIL